MPRTMTVTLYQFDELSDSAKERARDWYRSTGDTWFWQSEWWKSAQAFSAIAPIDISAADYDRRHVEYRWTGAADYDRRYVEYRWTGDDEVASLSGLRAWKWLQNNGWFDWAARNKAGECTMTGYCGDCPFGDAINSYARTPSRVPELRQVFYEAAQAWVNGAADDMEYSYSDESVDETIRCNEYEFDSEGNPA